MAKTTTLYIEDAEIKVLVNNGKKIEKWASSPLETGLVIDGLIQDETKVSEAIKTLFSREKIPAGRVVAAMSGLKSIFRIITLPAVPKNILDEAIKNEANRVIPTPMDQNYLSYQILPSAQSETKVFIVAHPKNTTDSVVRTINKAGLRLEVLDIAPLALCRCANLEKVIIVSNWLDNVDIAIIIDRIPQVIRSLSLPIESQSLAERISTIAEELARTITFYNSSHAESLLDESVPVLVSGELAKEPDSWPLLLDELSNQISILPSPFVASEDFDPSVYIVNMGMAIRELPASTDNHNSLINFNAMPGFYKPKGTSPAAILVPTVIVLLVGGLVWGWFYIDDMKQKNNTLEPQVQVQETALIQKRAELSAINIQLSNTQKSLTGIEPVVTVLNDMLWDMYQGRETITGDYKAIYNLHSSNIGFYTIDYGPYNGYKIVTKTNVLTIRGYGLTKTAILEYAGVLRGSNRWQDVIITQIVKDISDSVSTYDFEIVLIN
ncbi:pilus assembly protein PilM [Dehalococcoides mccartyi]|uniref:type IV pilus biogenesis protein PilM n=1 Tax=Dehalococcoides TaxID=61434 RepID=UPI003241C0EE